SAITSRQGELCPGSAPGPQFYPVSAIDYLTGYLMAFGAMVALARRAREGGSWLVRISLAQTGRWLVGRGQVPEAQLRDVPKEFTAAELERWTTTSDTPGGRLPHLAPVLRLSEPPPYCGRPSAPLGYPDGSPRGAAAPAAGLRVMDAEGIDAVLLYPTIGICWEGHVTDGALATAYTRAYNRWLAEFCRADPARLYPVAHISLLDPEGAVEETIRARRDGCVGIYLSPDLAARGGRHFDDPIFARFWETAQDLEMPIGFHVVVRDRPWFRQWQRRDPSDGLFSIVFLAIDVMAAFTQMLSAGMFERYPRLRCVVLEAGSNWIAAWLDRLDHKYRVLAHQTPIRMPP